VTAPELVPYWVEVLVSLLLVGSGVMALTGALGLARMQEFFQRMHPPALGMTLATWCACGASLVYFSALHDRPVIHAWLIVILLAITVPITTLLLARAALFRRRAAGDDVPPPLSQASDERRLDEAGRVVGDAGADLP
jgi:multicomponent K+:H+ antiporter subunit G